MPREEPMEDRLYRDPDLAQFYDLENRWGPDLDYCLRLADDARSVLDLGCGTGQLAARLSEECHVVGVDPARAMLEIARRRRGGKHVTWVEADARRVRLERRFDLVLLTGHAFQVFLTSEDQRAVLSTIAEHLDPAGRFVFDTRNPAAEEWLEWLPENSRRRFEAPGLGVVEAWNDAVYDSVSGIVTYQTHYRIGGSDLLYSASSDIRFTDRAPLAAMLNEAGLVVDKWLGDWNGNPCDSASPEFIAMGRLR